MISAITNTGKSMFALYDDSIATDNFIDFLEKVIKSNDKKIFMIVDNLRVHDAKLVKAWEEKHKDKRTISSWHEKKPNIYEALREYFIKNSQRT